MKCALRICHMIGSLQYGGAERQLVNTLNHLACKGKFAIVLQPPTTNGLYPLLGKDVIVFSMRMRVRFAPYHLWKISRVLKKWRIDVLHTHMFWANLYGALAAKIAGVPKVVTSEHGKNLWKNTLHRWIERNVTSRIADTRICVTEDILRIRREVDGIPLRKLVYIPNGTEIPHRVTRNDSKPVIIGTVGRLVEDKDHLTLVQSAAILRDSGLEFRLYILGDGPERCELEQEIAALGLQSIVQLPGFQSDTGRWLDITQRVQNVTFSGSPYLASSFSVVERIFLSMFYPPH